MKRGDIEKPVTVLIKEFRKQEEDLLNNSCLPWWKILDELEFIILPKVRQLAVIEEQKEQKTYEDLFKNEMKKKERD